jgi:hypothetical protein
MADMDRADAVHDVLQRALSLIEDNVEGRRLDLDVDVEPRAQKWHTQIDP